MIRELRRRLLLRAYAAAARWKKKTHPMMTADEVFVAGWLSGYRSARGDLKKKISLGSLYGKFTK